MKKSQFKDMGVLEMFILQISKMSSSQSNASNTKNNWSRAWYAACNNIFLYCFFRHLK